MSPEQHHAASLVDLLMSIGDSWVRDFLKNSVPGLDTVVQYDYLQDADFTMRRAKALYDCAAFYSAISTNDRFK